MIQHTVQGSGASRGKCLRTTFTIHPRNAESNYNNAKHSSHVKLVDFSSLQAQTEEFKEPKQLSTTALQGSQCYGDSATACQPVAFIQSIINPCRCMGSGRLQRQAAGRC